MDPKSTVVKSKSSNSAISKKSKGHITRTYDKKTRSNANFPCHSMKKRGVYVEKRLAKTNSIKNSNEDDCAPQKVPPRPRPGQKRFVASVLTILSKSTTGTQYPELNINSEKYKYRKKYENKSNNEQKNEDIKEIEDKKKSKGKFKSRVLNNKFVREDSKKMVILQSKKEISQTPSNYSDWSYKDSSQDSNLIMYNDSNTNAGLNIADELKNAVLEGRNMNIRKLSYVENEPKTLVADVPKVQKNLYNFFVDLLETTISVYNVQATNGPAGPSDSSKNNLQIKESVANRLDVGKVKKTVEFEDGISSPQHFNHIEHDTSYKKNFVNTKTKSVTAKFFKRELPNKEAQANTLSSFLHYTNTKKIPKKSKCIDVNQKTIFRNKNELMNVLKQELELDINTFEEPKSIFQALVVMARNKRQNSFDKSTDYKTFTDECVLTQRKVISSRKVKKNSKDIGVKNIRRDVRPIFNATDYVQYLRKPTSSIDRRDDDEIDDNTSYHSLEVYDFDYEPNVSKQSHYNKPKDIAFMYHSSPSHSDVDSDIQETLLYPIDTLSSIRKFSAVVD